MRPILTFVCGAIAGSAVWLLSPLITRHVEPWDSNHAYYLTALILIGITAGLIVRHHFWLTIADLYCGQAAILFTRSESGADRAPWWAGAFILGLFTLATILAGLIVMFGRSLLARTRRPASTP